MAISTVRTCFTHLISYYKPLFWPLLVAFLACIKPIIRSNFWQLFQNLIFCFNHNLLLYFWYRNDIDWNNFSDRLKFLRLFGRLILLRCFNLGLSWFRLFNLIQFLKLKVSLLIHELNKKFAIIVVSVKRDNFVLSLYSWFFFEFQVSISSQSLPCATHIKFIEFKSVVQ